MGVTNCKLGINCTCKTRKENETCKYWIPTRSSRHYYCAKWQLNRELCTCSKKEQKSCENYIPPGPVGRPPKEKNFCARCGRKAKVEVPKRELRIAPDFLDDTVHLCKHCAKALLR